MVIGDSDFEFKSTKSNETSAPPLYLASPMDRVAAFVIDQLIILGPIINLFVAPFERQMKEAIMVGDDPGMILNVAHAILMGLSILLIYHSVFLRLVGASLGQLVLGLRVVSQPSGKPLGLWNSILRAFLWLGNFLLLGIPSLAVFSDERRRTWYDRVSDSLVITLRSHRATQTPKIFQRSMVQGFISALVVFALFLLSIGFYTEVRDYDRKNKIYSMLEEEEVLCGVVGEAMEEWPSENGKPAERVSVALGLYFSGEIDLTCLEAEFDDRTFANQQDEMARLAKSFIYQDHDELSDLYLNSVCDAGLDTDPCRIAQTLLNPNQSPRLSALSAEAPVYLKIWGLKKDLSSARFADAQNTLEQLPKLQWMAGVRSVSQAKILWGLGQTEKAHGAAEIAYDFLSNPDRADLSAWLCLSELSQDCEAWDASSCSNFQDAVKSSEKVLKNVTASLAQVRKRRCEQNEDLSYMSLLKLNLNEEVRTLVNAQASNDRMALAEMVRDDDIDVWVRGEALVFLLENNPTPKETALALDAYMSGMVPNSENAVAPYLIGWAQESRDYETVIKIGERESSSGRPMSSKTLENYIVAEYHLGRKIKAGELLKSYQHQYPESFFESLSENERTPASVNGVDPEFALIVRSLK